MLAGAGLCTGSHGVGQFIGGRILTGFGIAFNTNAGPSLANELAHPRQRGTVASCFNALWYAGGIVAAWLTFGTVHMGNDWGW